MSDYQSDESFQDFNFWPSFTDLMLSLVLVMVLTVIVVRSSIEAGTVNLKEVQNHQVQMVERIARDFHATHAKSKTDDIYTIPVRFLLNGVSSESEITISNEPTLQRFSFKDRILFPSNEFRLSPEGRQTLMVVGTAIKGHLGQVREIQIQGHADTDRTFTHQSNLHLAAFRSIEVFNYLKDQVGIDPARYLMSATSFGEFKPVGRSDHDSTFTDTKLSLANRSLADKSQNRRIDILLFYRYRGDLTAQPIKEAASTAPATLFPAEDGNQLSEPPKIDGRVPRAPAAHPSPAPETAPPIRVSSSLLASRLQRPVATRYRPVTFDGANPDQPKVEIVVDLEGRVTFAKLAYGTPADAAAILKDVRQWRFTPLQAGGSTTPMTGLMAVQAAW